MRQQALWAGLVAAVVGITGCGNSIAPAEGVKDAGNGGGSQRYKDAWSAGPFVASNPIVNYEPLSSCPAPGGGTPVCDYHRITPPADVQNILVAIKANEGFEADDYDLFVYDDQGALLGASASGGSNESSLFKANGSAYYEVRVQPYTISPDSGYSGVATSSDLEIDKEPACDYSLLSGEEYPESVGISGVTDEGQEIELSVAVLLDGVDRQLASAVMARAADAYSPLNIKLTVAGIMPAVILSNDSTQIIQEAKDQTSGRPPFNADIVAVFTNRTMQSGAGGAGTVLGQADCIGGIRAPYNSYLVATIEPEDPFELIPGLALDVERGPETMAHEIGHLMGAHHHYGNCVEGVSPDDAVNGDVSPCDLMFPSVEPLSLQFATLPGAVVRGHAVDFAAP